MKCPFCGADLTEVGVCCEGTAAFFAELDSKGYVVNVSEVEVNDHTQVYCRSCDRNVNSVIRK